MTGGILQLVARGYDDLYMIKDPEITYFKIVYRRYTNFSIQPKIIKFNDNAAFGKIGNCKIKLLGDLVSKVYLGITLPEIDITKEYYTVSDIKAVLKKYDIYYINDDNSAKIEVDIYYEIRTLIITKINEVYTDYIFYIKQFKETPTDINAFKTAELKLAQLKTIGFEDTYGCWSFPVLRELFMPNLKQNALSSEVFNIFQSGKPRFAWINELAHYLVEYAEISIGGEVIDHHNSETIRSLSILNEDYEKKRGYNIMIGNTPELTDYNSEIKLPKTLYLPLRFWFCNHFSEALPIVSMPYSPVDITVKFRKFTDVSMSSSFKFKKEPKFDAFLMIHYIYVDEDERKRLCENKQEYLIETVESGNEEIFDNKNIIEAKNSIIQDINSSNIMREYYIEYRLGFNYTTKTILWVVKPLNINNTVDKFDWNFYINNSLKKYNPLTNVKIKFNGRDREGIQPYGVYQYWQPYKFFNSSIDNLFVYSFALYPQMLQPSGVANFGKLADSSLILYLNSLLTQYIQENNFKFKVTSYALNYNILRIFSGMAGLAFST
jgi:hypothetical protein